MPKCHESGTLLANEVWILLVLKGDEASIERAMMPRLSKSNLPLSKFDAALVDLRGDGYIPMPADSLGDEHTFRIVGLLLHVRISGDHSL